MDKPVLMENTKIKSYTVYNARTCSRMSNLRPVFASEVTPQMEVSAGLRIGTYSGVKKRPAPAAPVETPAAPVETPTGVTVQVRPDSGRPNTSGWTLAELTAYAQAHDIPIHPNAKEAGINRSIDRHFEVLSAGEG